KILSENRLGFTSVSNAGEDMVIDQSPLPGVEVDANTKIHLTIQAPENNNQVEEEKVLVPNALDKTIQEANKLLKSKGLNIDIEGTGISVKQNPKPGEYINKGAYVNVEFKPIE